MKKKRKSGLIAKAEFTASDTSILTPVNISSTECERTECVIALWDTGADFCGVTKELAVRLGLRQLGWKIVGYGNGEVVREPLYVAKLTFPQSGYSTEIQVIGSDSKSQDANIGMNFIRTGKFTLKRSPRMGFAFTFEKRL